MNSFLLLCDVFLFVFWKKLKRPKRHFETNWPLVCPYFVILWSTVESETVTTNKGATNWGGNDFRLCNLMECYHCIVSTDAFIHNFFLNRIKEFIFCNRYVYPIVFNENDPSTTVGSWDARFLGNGKTGAD